MSRTTAGRQSGYEKSDAEAGPVLRYALALLALIALALVVSGWVVRAFTGEERGTAPHPMVDFRAGPERPLLQPSPLDELRAVEARAQARLGEYAWVDRPNGVIQIPIERAMQLVLERGLPARGAQGD